MADEETSLATTGQSAGTAADATTPAGTGGENGQSPATAQTTTTPGTAAASGEDTFFDPTTLDANLVPAYKQMQRAFSKKMEEVKAGRQKIEAYDAFSRDPLGQIQAMASRLGYKLSRADAAAVADAAAGSGPWEPQTWDEVMTKAEERSYKRVMAEIAPALAEVQTVKRASIERMLDESCPDWRQYEDEMTALLNEHPTLAREPAKLYRLALPPEVLETRATQAALKKLQGKVDASKVGGTSTTKTPAASVPDKAMSFNEAVQYAKARLAEQGMRAPT